MLQSYKLMVYRLRKTVEIEVKVADEARYKCESQGDCEAFGARD